MKTALAFGLFVTLLMVPAPDAAAQGNGNGNGNRGRGRDRDRVCFYQDVDYHGWEECYNAGDELSDLKRHNNAISSIRVFGRARVTVYDDTEFDGRSAEFTSNVPDLGRRNMAGSRSWSDRIKSFQIDGASTSSSYGRPGVGLGRPDYGNGQEPRDGICVYEQADYRGRSECWSSGEQVRDLGRQSNLNDRISSIRILGRGVAYIYRDTNFQGESVAVDRDIPNLANLGGRDFGNWNDQVSSLEVEGQRGRARARR